MGTPQTVLCNRACGGGVERGGGEVRCAITEHGESGNINEQGPTRGSVYREL